MISEFSVRGSISEVSCSGFRIWHVGLRVDDSDKTDGSNARTML